MSIPSVKKLAAVGLLALAGCSYNLTLTSTMSGDTVASGQASKYGKIVSITLDRQIYSGHYDYPTQAPISLADFADSMPTAAGFVVGVNAVGRGTIVAATANRDQLRCVFNYDDDKHQGMGQCVTQGGRVFALNIQKL